MGLEVVRLRRILGCYSFTGSFLERLVRWCRMTPVILSVEEAKRRPCWLSDNVRWVYIGKDLRKRETIFRALPKERLFSLGEGLHEVAEQMRQPFLDFIAELGKRQHDQLAWWSSSCSWKSSSVSDLFLLVCYLNLIRKLLREWRHDPLLVVVEDPWLFCQIKKSYAGTGTIGFGPAPALWPSYARELLPGLAARMVWAVRLIRNYLKQRWHWRGGKHEGILKDCVALYSYPQARCFIGSDDWYDPYLGDLERQLRDAGYTVCRFTPPEVGGFEEQIAQRRQYVSPLILWCNMIDLLRAIFVFWRPVGPVAPAIAGQTVEYLLLREWWKDRWRSSHMLHRIFYDCMRRFLQSSKVKLLIYQYENQPWEKMLLLAAQSTGVPTLGYQHGGGLSRFMLPYFYGLGEAEWAPLPDLVMTSGPYSREILANGGVPADRLVMGGTLRYKYLSSSHASAPVRSSEGRPRILVSLPIYSDLAQHLLYALKRAFPDGGATEGLEFGVRSHPMCPIHLRRLGWPVEIIDGSFEEALLLCNAVIYTGSSTGLEASVMGRQVIRYRSELLPILDRGEFLNGNGIVDCTDNDLKGKVLSVLEQNCERTAHQALARDTVRLFFPPADRAVWLKTVEQLYSSKVSTLNG